MIYKLSQYLLKIYNEKLFDLDLARIGAAYRSRYRSWWCIFSWQYRKDRRAIDTGSGEIAVVEAQQLAELVPCLCGVELGRLGGKRLQRHAHRHGAEPGVQPGVHCEQTKLHAIAGRPAGPQTDSGRVRGSRSGHWT